LVSISQLLNAGYVVLFCEDSCKIFDAKKLLGEIPVNKGLYCIKGPKRPFMGAAKVNEALTMCDAHARLGHITPDSIKYMLKDGVITGIMLDPSDFTMDKCGLCEYAKATQKAIGKMRDPLRCEHFSDKVHTDLWGPSPVKTPGQKEYFASFTED
ncbi:hypothetical protein BDR06DRAFT_827506, partial [Suillus hirtellus]